MVGPGTLNFAWISFLEYVREASMTCCLIWLEWGLVFQLKEETIKESEEQYENL